MTAKGRSTKRAVKSVPPAIAADPNTITDDEFERLLDQIQAGAPGANPCATALPVSKSDSITDSEFEKLLDDLQATKKSPQDNQPVAAVAMPTAEKPRDVPVRTENAQRWVCFALGEQTYGVEVLQVQEVLHAPVLTPIPGAPVDVLGVINLRGAMVAVLDLHAPLKIPAKPAEDCTRVIVVCVAGATVGLRVDRVSDVLQLRQDETLAPPTLSQSGPAPEIKGLALYQDRLVILLNLTGVLKRRSGA